MLPPAKSGSFCRFAIRLPSLPKLKRAGRRRILPRSIGNCFKHAGFTTPVQASRTDCAPASPDEDLDEDALDGESSGSAVPLSLTNAWGNFEPSTSTSQKNSPLMHSFADDDIVLYEKVTDEAIIESVHEADDTEDQEETHAEKPNPRVVLDARNILRSFFGAHDNDVAMDHFFECEGRALKLLHDKLTDFWQ
ncbi:hypothetical protein HPB51_019393 [Rhipicephalus microplus]|uniref:Uncharacterized protein n=1 Tax=Rhipicephalus microplus TaxID=6941 RepID=A0A9J6DB82_RHIMP|nr:hypothetical protein HPB51_019393 [Rhipicephalus microplus]